MAELRPFKGIRYNPRLVKDDLASVCAPPYDVITPEMQDKLYGQSPYNIVKLILGKTAGDDTDSNNRYTRARDLFYEWINNEVMKKDDEDSFYVYKQEYEVDGKPMRRIGFIGLMKIEESGKKGVLPHEHTHASPKEDRLCLLKQVRANLSPIFALYSDIDRKITGILESATGPAPLTTVEISGVKHQLWKLSDRLMIGEIVAAMDDRKIFIADGHHRYEVARKFKDIMKGRQGIGENAGYVMVYFSDMDSKDNLTVLATHRVIRHMPDVSKRDLESGIRDFFDIHMFDGLDEMMKNLADAHDRHAFGFFDGEKYMLLDLRDEKNIDKLVREDKSRDWKKLDVSILHYGIFDNILDIKCDEGNIRYVVRPGEAETMVRSGEYAGAFFLNPTKIDQLRSVAENNDMMPQKSTYFYPKLLTGLVINSLD